MNCPDQHLTGQPAPEPFDLEQLRSLCRDDRAFEQLQELLAKHQVRLAPLDSLLEQTALQRQQALFHVVSQIRKSLDLETIFQTTAREVRQLLQADRVGMFRFYPGTNWNDGEFVSEDVLPNFSSALAAQVHDHCFGDRYAPPYRMGRYQAVSDIYKAELHPCHVEVLSRFQVRANLVVSLLQGDMLWGLLCIHQCSAPREWQPDEIEFVQQIAAQLSVALQQAELLAQTQQQSIALAETLEKLQKSQMQLVQAEKMSSLGQLVAGIAHEINNPVNFIYGNLNHVSQYAHDLLELLALYRQEHPQPSAALADRIEEIDLPFLATDFPRILASMEMGADRIRQIVLSLRNFSRLDEARMKSVNLHEGIESTLLILQHRLKPSPCFSKIELIKDYGNLPLVECYASQINQVFMNLLSNAIDALEAADSAANDSSTAPPSRRITIQTRSGEDENGTPIAIVRIEDNGQGISVTDQAKLFNPFFTTKPVGKGTGLGLSISYQIVVDRHGGQLRCLSQPGAGSTFIVEIPIDQRRSRFAQDSCEPGEVLQVWV